VERGGFTIPQLQKYIADFKRLRPYYYADYYPLTPNENITTDSIWLSYQLNRPAEGDGIILAFRRPACPIDKITVKLSGLLPDAQYQLWFEDENKTITQSGKELMDHLDLILNEKNRSLLISYKKI
jgi:alpha-galactosidase